jgi:hypothetical protein
MSFSGGRKQKSGHCCATGRVIEIIQIIKSSLLWLMADGQWWMQEARPAYQVDAGRGNPSC